MERVAASTALLCSSILLHSQPSSFPAAGKSCQPTKDLEEWGRGVLHQQTLPSACSGVGTGRWGGSCPPSPQPGQVGSRLGWGWMGTGMVRMGEEGNLSQLIYFFRAFQAASRSICHRASLSEDLCTPTVTLSLCLILIQLKPQLKVTGGFLS